MDNLAQSVLDNAAIAYTRAQSSGKAKRKATERQKARQRRQYRRLASKRPPRVKHEQVKPWNELGEMRLFLCASVRERLRELDNRDYERKYG